MADATHSTLDQQALAAFTARADTGPVQMLNLLRFKPGGAAAYQRYSDAVAPLLAAAGGSVTVAGRGAEPLIGDQAWDLVLVVTYPTRGALLAMLRSEAYQQAMPLRAEALEQAVLYALDPVTPSCAVTQVRSMIRRPFDGMTALLLRQIAWLFVVVAPGFAAEMTCRLNARTCRSAHELTDDPSAEEPIMPSTATTVDAYLAALPAARREAIAAVREVIRANLPAGYEEVMAWGMICYQVPLATYPDTYNKKPLMYAALASQKNHMAVYLTGIYTSEAKRAAFEDAYRATGKRFDCGKSCVRFRQLEHLPLELIGDTIASMPVADLVAVVREARTPRRARKRRSKEPDA